MNKAQVSVYIILGVILLIGVGVFIYSRNSLNKSQPLIEVPGKVQSSGQAQLISFMDSCIRDAAFNGLEIVRLQGGYIDIPSDTKTILYKDPSGEQVVEENGIKKVETALNGPGNMAAYWLDSANALRLPPPEYVARQLSNYMDKSVLSCVNNFDSFRSQGYTINFSAPVSNVSFSNEILVNVNLPVHMEKGAVSFDQNQFILRIPINIQKALNAEQDIVAGEYETSFLESDIKYLISLYSYGGNSKGTHDLPPLAFTDASMSCKMVTWQLSEVQDKLMTNIYTNAKYLKLFGAGDSVPNTNSRQEQGTYLGLTSDVLPPGFYENINVSFDPAAYGLVFDIQPRSGTSVRPDRHTATGIPFLPLFCNIGYRFKYTLKFPMVSHVVLDDSPGVNLATKTVDPTKHFDMLAPIGIYLCGNQNRQCTGKSPYADINFTLNMSYLAAQNITLPTETMFCDDDQRLSQPIHLTVLDAYTNKPVPDANVFYKCGNEQNDCLIDVTNASGELLAKFPLCINGALYILNDNFSQKTEIFTSKVGNTVLGKTLLAEPLKELQVEVKQINLPLFIGNYFMSNGFTVNKCTGATVKADNESMGVSDLGGRDVMIISNSGPSQASLLYPAPANYFVSGNANTIKLASGTYTFSYTLEGPVQLKLPTISGQQLSASNSMLNKSFFNNSDLSESDLQQARSVISGTLTKLALGDTITMPLGSYEMPATFTLDQLKNATKIIFYVPAETMDDKIDFATMPHSVQPDNSIYMKGMIDSDCNPQTPTEQVEINISSSQVAKLLAPRLE